MNAKDFIAHINTLRKTNKGKWYWFTSDNIDGKNIQLKGYGTWLQIYKVDGIDYYGLMDISVKDFTATLAKPFN